MMSKNEDMAHGNKVIAEFMPNLCRAESMMDMGITQWLDDDGEYYTDEELCFHSSWDWLMPVVEKIEKTPTSDESWADVIIGSGKYCVIQDAVEGQFEFTGMEETKILSVWKACVEFIEWHNNQKQKDDENSF